MAQLFLSNNIEIKRIREQVVRDHPSEARRTWTQVWDKLKRHYHKK